MGDGETDMIGDMRLTYRSSLIFSLSFLVLTGDDGTTNTLSESLSFLCLTNPWGITGDISCM